MATPLTELRLLSNVDLDTTYRNTFSTKLFGSLAGQISFFQGKTASGMTFTNLTFQRKERSIKVRKTYEQVEPLTYGMFKNGTTGKWYLFFIEDIVYVSQEVTEIIIQIDVEQTYLFDATMKDCFVEREHVADDTIGLHRVPENLDIGDVEVVSKEDVDQIKDLYFMLGTTVDENLNDVYGDIYSGLYGGLAYYAATDEVLINNIIQDLQTGGKLDALQVIFTMPQALVADVDPTTFRIDSPSGVSLTESFTKNTTDLGGYVPKNNKLFVYPYNFLEVTNNKGANVIYPYEEFSTANCGFAIQGHIAPNPTTYMIPLSYKGTSINHEQAITLSDYPLCSWTGDIYSNWLAQNQVSNALSVGSSVLGLGVGVATGNPIAIGSGVIGVAGSIGNFYEKSILPNPLKGSTSGGGNVSIGIQTFTAYKKCVREEFAKIIDDFFTKFGYKVNVLKTPDVTTRPYWNYIKLQEVVISGNIPRSALAQMITNREQGITFWHTDAIGNYSLDNAV